MAMAMVVAALVQEEGVILKGLQLLANVLLTRFGRSILLKL